MGWLRRLVAWRGRRRPDLSDRSAPALEVVLPPASTLTSATIATGSTVGVHRNRARLPEIADRDVTAQLVADPTGSEGTTLIAVFLGSAHVGWLDPVDGEQFQPLLIELAADGVPAAAAARIAGSGSSASLTLDAELPPRRRTSADPVLVGGVGDVNVVGEDRNQEFLRSKMGPSARHDFVARLTVGGDGLIEVSYDGVIVGRLTARMSPRYRPVVDHLVAMEWPATCRARIAPGATKLEVVLSLPQGTRLHRLIHGIESA